MKTFLLIGFLIFVGLISQHATAQTLLPNGEQTFVDGNGVPFAGGQVFFYIPNTTTPKTTWSNAAGTTPNTNPVVLDGAGRAIIYGAGTYRQVLKDQFGNTIWDQITQGYGSSNQSVTHFTGNGTVTTCNGYFGVNNVGLSTVTITLPSAPNEGDLCWFVDSSYTSSSHPIILYAGAKTFVDGGNTYTIAGNGSTYGILYLADVGKWAIQ